MDLEMARLFIESSGTGGPHDTQRRMVSAASTGGIAGLTLKSGQWRANKKGFPSWTGDLCWLPRSVTTAPTIALAISAGDDGDDGDDGYDVCTVPKQTDSPTMQYGV